MNGNSIGQSYARASVIVFFVLLCPLWLAGCSKRQPVSSDPQQRVLDSLQDRNWYVKDTDSYRPMPVSAEVDDGVRVTGWEKVDNSATKPAPPPATGTAFGSGGSWLDGLSILMWLTIGALLIALAALLASTSMRMSGRTKKLKKTVKAIEIDPARVTDLPFEAEAEMTDPLEAARRMANAGDYDAAVQFLYGYMLLALDRAGKLALHRGKTNRMYLFELGSEREIRELLSPVMLAFEDVFFGRHSIDRGRFQELWQTLAPFHRLLAPIMASREAAKAASEAAPS